jgi:hypothetical protein
MLHNVELTWTHVTMEKQHSVRCGFHFYAVRKRFVLKNAKELCLLSLCSIKLDIDNSQRNWLVPLWGKNYFQRFLSHSYYILLLPLYWYFVLMISSIIIFLWQISVVSRGMIFAMKYQTFLTKSQYIWGVPDYANCCLIVSLTYRWFWLTSHLYVVW